MFKRLKTKGAVKLDAYNIIYIIIGAVVAFTALAALLPDFTTAGDEVNSTGVPFAGFFASDGILVLAFMAGLALTAIALFMPKKGR
jgi:hypothetical protein